MRKTTPIAVRFRKHFDEAGPDECWNWKGYCGSTGHPQIRNGGLMYAHRLSYELANGSIPAGKVVRHMCNNAKCVNPAHLQTGTLRDNAQDTVRAGRWSKSGNRMSEAMQNAIDEAMQGGIPLQIARKWGVHAPTLYHHLNKRKALAVAS